MQNGRSSVETSPVRRPLSVRGFVLRFVLVFALLEGFVYLVLWRASWFTPYAELNARLTAAMLSPWLEGASASGAFLTAPEFSIRIRPGCDAYQACAVLLAGILAFPAPGARKLVGASVGVLLLLLLNVVRLGALMWTGIYQHAYFDTMHLEILPGVFLISALFLWIAWMLWARGAEQV